MVSNLDEGFDVDTATNLGFNHPMHDLAEGDQYRIVLEDTTVFPDLSPFQDQDYDDWYWDVSGRRRPSSGELDP